LDIRRLSILKKGTVQLIPASRLAETATQTKAHVILVVEDEATLRDLVTEFLRDEGYHVVEARDGHEAIRLLDEHHSRPDELCIVLLDMMLPQANGLAVLEHLAAVSEYIPVIAMSASRAALTQAVSVGAREVLAKPFDLDRLLRVVERNCRCASA
jgi:two-component system, OmpR family, response regulator ArlR